MKHTPGPWSLRKEAGRQSRGAGDEQVYRIEGARTLDLLVCPHPDGYVIGENEANARLIAAEPDTMSKQSFTIPAK